mmetsp:Transcript_58777/g.96548  ORF Transcript_58777/g.96548 Transcript_58777/m.96548 type:complete len:81 (+) Transcript_58777:1456-1698(+)
MPDLLGHLSGLGLCRRLRSASKCSFFFWTCHRSGSGMQFRAHENPSTLKSGPLKNMSAAFIPGAILHAGMVGATGCGQSC